MKKLLKIIILKLKYKNCEIHSKDITFNIKLSEFCRIYKGVYIDRDVSIGRYTYVNDNTKIYANTSIGAFCSIAPNVTIAPGEHDYTKISTHPLLYDKKWNKHIMQKDELNKKTIIENDVWIGCNSIIKAGVVVGNGSIIGAGAVVTKSVPPYSIVVGNPAKIIKYRFDEQKIKKLLNEQWWNKDINYIIEFFSEKEGK